MGMDEVQEALKKRYPHIHPLLFQRACEKARTNGELFDMLETMPEEYPIVWDEERREWVVTDLLQSENAKLKEK